jgi:hypothetical protein
MVRPLRWTPQLVQQFWDGVAQIDSMERVSFAHLAGPALVEFMTPWIPPDAELLDFGGGSGHLVQLLVSAGYRAAATDPSAKREEATAKTLSGDGRFLGLIPPTSRAPSTSSSAPRSSSMFSRKTCGDSCVACDAG